MCKIGKKTKYRGWLIVRESEDSYLCFTPDEADYPEKGYEDWETDSLAAAKDWVDCSISDDCGRKVKKTYRPAMACR